jgi:hypothetical protein
MKFLQKIPLIAMAHAASVIPTEIACTINQITKFNEFANESWKSKSITIGGDAKTIEQHIVDAFNAVTWTVGGRQTKINKRLNNDIKKYYNSELDDPANMPNKYNPANPIKWTNDLDTNDSPREWLQKLYLRELYRFQSYITVTHTNLINNTNYATDDLVKARSLCGIFWIVDRTDTANITAEKAFSGMLVPYQAFGNTHYEVYACGHGFTSGNARNNITYYFVPYGVEVDDNPAPLNNNFAGKKGFAVTEIKRGTAHTAAFQSINDEYFEKTHIKTVNQYDQDDYAVVRIQGTNTCTTKNTLKEALADALIDGTRLGIVKDTDTHLPNINSRTTIDTATPFNPNNNERLFIIGWASQNFELDSSGLTVSTSIINNETLTPSPRRSLKDDEYVKVPTDIGQKTNEYCSSLAVYPGMSGGSILRCKMDTGDEGIKACAVIATLWGAERVFINNNGTEKIEKFGCFINKKP